MTGCVCVRDVAERALLRDVAHDVRRLHAVERVAVLQIGEGVLRPAVAERVRDAVAQRADLARQRVRNPLEVRAPLRHRRAARMRLDAQPARPDLLHAQRAPFEQEHVADVHARCEALVEPADPVAARARDRNRRLVRDRADVLEVRARRLAAQAVHGLAVGADPAHVRFFRTGAAAAEVCDARAQIVLAQVAVRIGAPRERERSRRSRRACRARTTRPATARRRRAARPERRSLRDPVADAAARRRRFDDVVAVLREHDAGRDRAGPVPRAADALQRRRHPARAAEHDHAVDVADVDAELERARADDGAQLAAAQLGLGTMAHVALERAVVHADAPVARRGLAARRVLGNGDLAGRLHRPVPSRAPCAPLGCARW